MSLSLPYSRNRRYLTGIDWTIGTLNCISQRFTGVGNLSQVILELDGCPDEVRLREALREISRKLPVVHGCVARDWVNLAPYWKVGAVGEIPLRVAEVEDAAQAEELLTQHVNTPLAGEREHLRLLLVKVGE